MNYIKNIYFLLLESDLFSKKADYKHYTFYPNRLGFLAKIPLWGKKPRQVLGLILLNHSPTVLDYFLKSHERE
jgi:hypothetical protein